jgi:hypothetical protein
MIFSFHKLATILLAPAHKKELSKPIKSGFDSQWYETLK